MGTGGKLNCRGQPFYGLVSNPGGVAVLQFGTRSTLGRVGRAVGGPCATVIFSLVFKKKEI